jgi:hypothetical protein
MGNENKITGLVYYTATDGQTFDRGETVDFDQLPDGELERAEELGAFNDPPDPDQAGSAVPPGLGGLTEVGHGEVASPLGESHGDLGLAPGGEEDDRAAVSETYESRDKESLQAEADRRDVTVEGTGANGNVTKADLVSALKREDESEAG